MNKIYDVTLESPTLECNITLHSRADVECLQDFIWDCTNFEMCVKPRDEQGLKGLFEDMADAFDKFCIKGIGNKELHNINTHIVNALEETHKELLELAVKRIKEGKELRSIEIKADVTCVEEVEDDE